MHDLAPFPRQAWPSDLHHRARPRLHDKPSRWTSFPVHDLFRYNKLGHRTSFVPHRHLFPALGLVPVASDMSPSLGSTPRLGSIDKARMEVSGRGCARPKCGSFCGPRLLGRCSLPLSVGEMKDIFLATIKGKAIRELLEQEKISSFVI